MTEPARVDVGARPSSLPPLSRERQTGAAAGTRPRRRTLHLVAVTLALSGWVMGVGLCAVLVASGDYGGDMDAYVRAGRDLVSGDAVYVGVIGEHGAFSYAPPWAILFGALAWVPSEAMVVCMFGLSLLSVRYLAGSWLWAGLAFLYPVSVIVMLSGNIEFLIAAAIVMAARGHSGPLALTAMAKVAPILAIPRDGWREAGLVILVAVLVTLPWLHLWPEWVEYLLRQPSTIAIHIAPPWYLRLPFALALLLLRRPWAAALAVVVAMPSLWLGTLVILGSAMRLWLDGRRPVTGQVGLLEEDSTA